MAVTGFVAPVVGTFTEEAIGRHAGRSATFTCYKICYLPVLVGTTWHGITIADRQGTFINKVAIFVVEIANCCSALARFWVWLAVIDIGTRLVT